MATKDALVQARKEAGLTQEELARKVYVTRQAISRWETGETTPSIDMTKLLASALGVPVTQLLDLPAEPACQCCGTPFSVPHMERGADAGTTPMVTRTPRTANGATTRAPLPTRPWTT